MSAATKPISVVPMSVVPPVVPGVSPSAQKKGKKMVEAPALRPVVPPDFMMEGPTERKKLFGVLENLNVFKDRFEKVLLADAHTMLTEHLFQVTQMVRVTLTRENKALDHEAIALAKATDVEEKVSQLHVFLDDAHDGHKHEKNVSLELRGRLKMFEDRVAALEAEVAAAREAAVREIAALRTQLGEA